MNALRAPILLIPAAGEPADGWHRLADALTANGAPVTLIDARADEAFEARVRRVRDALAALGRPAVLVGHHGGGAVMTAAATRRSAAHLIYVAGEMPDYGETVTDNVTPIGAVAWRAVPSTYVLCARDRRFPLAAQQRVAELRATTIARIDAGDDVATTHAEALAQIVREDAAAEPYAS
ncbi:MAG TPA: hypothetical protein VMA36_01175 [Candidatus Limnocylindria bacterium]|nr:hypothetical protein [Candidatus Limnocylindria bacterium]